MSAVTASITIPRPPAEVWRVAMDPHRLADWVTIHRELIRADEGPARAGFEMEQRIELRGLSLDIHWLLIECTPFERAIWEGQGPGRSTARTEYALSAQPDGGTRFDYRNEFRVPFGALGAFANRILVGGIPQAEAERTLHRLRELLAPLSGVQ